MNPSPPPQAAPAPLCSCVGSGPGIFQHRSLFPILSSCNVAAAPGTPAGSSAIPEQPPSLSFTPCSKASFPPPVEGGIRSPALPHPPFSTAASGLLKAPGFQGLKASMEAQAENAAVCVTNTDQQQLPRPWSSRPTRPFSPFPPPRAQQAPGSSSSRDEKHWDEKHWEAPPESSRLNCTQRPGAQLRPPQGCPAALHQQNNHTGNDNSTQESAFNRGGSGK